MNFGKSLFLVLVSCVAFNGFAAMEFKEADITTIKNIVERNEGTGAVPAKVNDKVTEKSVVSTAASSMAELTFADSSITRMGSNTQFSFKSKERLVKLEQGTLLIHTPPGNGGATVDCGGVTAAVSGTTFMASRDGVGNVMFVLLEGQGGLKVTAGGSTTVIRPGQAASVGADSAKEAAATPAADKGPAAPSPETGGSGRDQASGGQSGSGSGPAPASSVGGGDSGGTPPPAAAAAPKIQVFDIDVKKVVTTSPLVVDFKAELPSAAKIEKTVETQQQAVKEGKLEKLEVEAVAVKSGDGDLLVGAPKVEKEEFVVLNKKLNIAGTSSGGDGLDIETAAGPGTGGGTPVAAAPAPRAATPAPAPAPLILPTVNPGQIIGNLLNTAISTSQPAIPAPSRLDLSFSGTTGTVTLNRAALEPTTVNLSGLSGLPASVVIPAGSTSANFILPTDNRDFFPGFIDSTDPSAGYRPLSVTAAAGSLSASANATPGWFDGASIRAANPVRGILSLNSMDGDEVAALDAFFYFRNAVSGTPMNFYEAVKNRSLDLNTLNLSVTAIQSLAGSANAAKDYVFGRELTAKSSAPFLPINLGFDKPGTVFFADRIHLGADYLPTANPLTWLSLAGSAGPWEIPDGNPAGASEQVNAAWSYGNLPLAARLSLKISPLPADTSGNNFYLGDYAAYLRHTSPEGETRTVRLFDRIGATATDPAGSAATGLDVILSDWQTADINQQDTTGTITGILGGSYRPGYGGWPVALNDLVSIDPNGAWTLFVADLSTGALGRVEDWSLELASVFQPQHTINLAVPPAGASDPMVTFASGNSGSTVLSTRLAADGASMEFLSAGAVEMRQTQFENLGSKFTVEAAGKVSLGAAPAAHQETADREQVRILANTVTGAGGAQVPVPGSMAVIRSGDSLELRNVTIRGFSQTRLEKVNSATKVMEGRVLMSGSTVRDFRIKELTGAAVNADAKIQMMALDQDGSLAGEMMVEGRMPVEAKIASALKEAGETLPTVTENEMVDAKQIELAADSLKLVNANLVAMNSITARANTIVVQNSFMTVVQNSGMINMYVQTGRVNPVYGQEAQGYANFIGRNVFQVGNTSIVLNNSYANDLGVNQLGTNLLDVSHHNGIPQAGKVNVLKL